MVQYKSTTFFYFSLLKIARTIDNDNIYTYSTKSLEKLNPYFTFSPNLGAEFCLGYTDKEIKKKYPTTIFKERYSLNDNKVLIVESTLRQIILFFDENDKCYESIFMSKLPELLVDKINLIAENNIIYHNDGKRIIWLIKGEREKIAITISAIDTDGQEYTALCYQIL